MGPGGGPPRPITFLLKQSGMAIPYKRTTIPNYDENSLQTNWKTIRLLKKYCLIDEKSFQTLDKNTLICISRFWSRDNFGPGPGSESGPRSESVAAPRCGAASPPGLDLGPDADLGHGSDHGPDPNLSQDQKQRKTRQRRYHQNPLL